MASASITTRVTKKGEKKYVVRFRLGGRAYPVQHGGSFPTLREARVRRDLIAGELAAGRNPVHLLEQLHLPPARMPGLAQRWDEFMASRVDIGVKAQAKYRNARDRWVPLLGAEREPHAITVAEIIAGIAELAKTLKPVSVEQYLSTLRQVLDFCDVTPNPVRSPKVKVPMAVREEINPPRSDEWVAILEQVRRRSRLAFRLIECCGLRISEACNLTWGDVDLVEGQIRIAKTKTAAGRRWLPVPDELLA